MEILIDAELVRRVLADEREAARRDLRAAGPHFALERSQGRHDSRLSSAPDVGTLDCREGCAWCCHFSVDVRPVEAFAIAGFVAAHFSEEQQARLRAEVSANAQALRGLDDLQRMQSNLRCPFLVDARCSIYPVRPQTCRNYHATDVTGCRRSFDEPGNLDIDPDFAPGVFQAGGAHVEAFSATLREAGYDVDAYELNAALDIALRDPAARDRFTPAAKPLGELEGNPVPDEFADEGEDEGGDLQRAP